MKVIDRFIEKMLDKHDFSDRFYDRLAAIIVMSVFFFLCFFLRMR